MNRDLDNELTEHFYLTLNYTKEGVARSLKTIAYIQNLTAPLLSIGTQNLDEGQEKSVYGFLSYPIDVPGSLLIESVDVTASEAQADYERIRAVVYVAAGSVSDPIVINALFDSKANEPIETYSVTALFVAGSSPNQATAQPNQPYNAGQVQIKNVNRGVSLKLKEEKLAYVLSGDDDFDQKLDMHDFDGGPVRKVGDRRFVPAELIVNWDDLRNSTAYYSLVRVRFKFKEASGQSQITLGPETDELARLWKKPWDSSRSSSDRINSDKDYSLSSLGIVNGQKTHVYIEAVTPGYAASEVLASITVEVTFPNLGNSSGSDLSTNFSPPLSTKAVANSQIRYRYLPDKFDNDQPDWSLTMQLKAMYDDLYRPTVLGAQTPDPINDFLLDKRRLQYRVRELNDWSWASPIFAPDIVGDPNLEWIIVIDRSTVLTKGPVWGVSQMRNLMFASLGTQESQVMHEFYSSGVNNFQDYQIDGGRIEAIKAQMALWAQTLNATIDTAATIAYASAEIGISFLPGGDVLFTAINIATNENLPKLTEEQSIAIGMQAATSLIPFVPSFLKKAVNSQVGELISFVWKKEGQKFTRLTAGVKDGERLAAKFVDEAYDQSFFHMDSWCFAAETMVHTCERMIPIESIEVGQNVKAFNFDSGSWICSQVQEVHRNLYSGNLYTVRTGESQFRATVGHPVFVVRGADLELRPWPRQLSLTAEAHSFAFGR